MNFSDKETFALQLIEQGRLKEAEKIYHELINLGLKTDIVYGNLAAVLGMQERFDEAVFYLKESIKINPINADAHNNLGIIRQNKGNLASAIKSYRKSLAIQPCNPQFNVNMGSALREFGDYSAAITCYEKALSIDDKHIDAYYNLGVIFVHQGKFNSAMDCYKKTISLNYNQPKAHNNLGLIFKKLDMTEEAVKCYKIALSLNPNYSEACNNLGVVLQELGSLDQAMMCFKNALSLNPNYSEASNNLGVVFQELGSLGQAIACHKDAININPVYAEAYCNMGSAYFGDGKFQDAIFCYEKAIEYKPGYPEAQFNIALVQLFFGDYNEGWRGYEYRLKFKHRCIRKLLIAAPACKTWNSADIYKSQKLLLVGEQGLGDILHFMRYAIVLKNRNISISLCAPSKLHGLIKASGIDKSPLTPEQADLVQEGQWLPLLSVPRYLNVSPDNPIITEPYIKTTDELRAKWKKVLSFEKRPIVGINWQGNPFTEKNAQLGGRSLPLEAFSPLTSDTNVSLLSLQKGFGSEQLQSCTFKECFVKCQDQVSKTWDFLETAAVILNCDLIVTSDTAVAHLSAGLGKKTWLLLHAIPDWRWGITGEKSFWYPSIRLFRQKKSGNWDDVIALVAEALRKEFF